MKNDEVDLMQLLLPFWKNRKHFFIYCLIAAFLGIVFSFGYNKEYKAETVFIPQIDSKSAGLSNSSFGGLATLAGVKLNSSEGTINFPPELYPNLKYNVEIQLELLNAKLFIPDLKDSVTYRYYYKNLYKPSLISVVKSYTFGLPGILLNLMRGPSNSNSSVLARNAKYYSLSMDDYLLIEKLKSQMSIEPDEDDYSVVLAFLMEDPLYASQMAGHLERIVHKELISFRLSKINSELSYLEKTLDEKLAAFENAQQALSYFKDRNQVLTTSSSQNTLRRLENDYDIAFSIYKELLVAFEQKKIEKSKTTPLIKTIRPIVIPNLKVSPNRLLIAFSFVILAILLFIFKFIVRPQLQDVLKKISTDAA